MRDVMIVMRHSVAAAQDGEQNQRADDGNDDRGKTAEAVREENEHRLILSGETPSVCIIERWMASRLNHVKAFAHVVGAEPRARAGNRFR